MCGNFQSFLFLDPKRICAWYAPGIFRRLFFAKFKSFEKVKYGTHHMTTNGTQVNRKGNFLFWLILNKFRTFFIYHLHWEKKPKLQWYCKLLQNICGMFLYFKKTIVFFFWVFNSMVYSFLTYKILENNIKVIFQYVSFQCGFGFFKLR